MKRIFLYALLMMGLVMCSSPVKKSDSAGSNTLSIYYFHGTNRCGNCMAIDEHTKKALELYFPAEMKAGRVKFVSVNVDEAANKSLVDKCEASAMMLYFIKTNGEGKETINDYSEFAINNARSKPDAYMQGIRDRVAEQLK
jgi:thiol-disulfide isomerase/thioredoxin